MREDIVRPLLLISSWWVFSNLKIFTLSPRGQRTSLEKCIKRKQRAYFSQSYIRQELFSTSQQGGEGWIKTLMRNSSLTYILYTFAFVCIKILILLSTSKQDITFMDISEGNRKLKSSQFIFQFFFFHSLTSHLPPTLNSYLPKCPISCHPYHRNGGWVQEPSLALL